MEVAEIDIPLLCREGQLTTEVCAWEVKEEEGGRGRRGRGGVTFFDK